MPRARNIKPGFFANELLVEMDYGTRLLFIGLWTIADRAGRLEDRPKRIKMQLFPADDIDVHAALDCLVDAGFICRYQCGDDRYIEVKNFEKHQSPHIKEPASTIPPPHESGASTMLAPDSHHASRADCGFPITDCGLLTADCANPVQEPDAPVQQPQQPQEEDSNERTYVTTIGKALPKVEEQFATIHRQLGDGWLVQTLGELEPDIGPLPRDRLGKGLSLAADQIGRKVVAGKIESPRGFARKLIRDYLQEQRDGIPTPSSANGVRAGPAVT